MGAACGGHNMWNQVLSDEVLETLRCCLCNEFLSLPPIYMYPSGLEVACGRCPILTDNNPIRNVIYEAIASHILFPCKNKTNGCCESVAFNDMALHEENCPYRPFFCPFLPLATCSWQGPWKEVFDHYAHDHQWLTLTEPEFELDLVSTHEENYLLKDGTDLFLVQIKSECKGEAFWFTVRYIGCQSLASTFHYAIVLRSFDEGATMELPSRPVETDTFVRIEEKTATKVDTEHVKMDLGNPPNILCCIRIIRKNPKANDDDDDGVTAAAAQSTRVLKTLASQQSIDEDLLRELECPVCNEYMQPPIHQCLSGHSICAECKPLIAECPVCRGVIKDTRNFLLEKMTPMIKFRCKYKDYDCSFIGNLDRMRIHEEECEFGPYECPLVGHLMCSWQGKLTDVLHHIEEMHPDVICHSEINTLSLSSADEGSSSVCFIKLAYKNIFKVFLKSDNAKLFLSVQLVGPSENANNFSFDFDLVDNMCSGRKLYLKEPCQCFTSYDRIFELPGTYRCLPEDLLTPLVGEEALTYRFHIYKT